MKKQDSEEWFENLSEQDKRFFELLEVDKDYFIEQMYDGNNTIRPYSYILKNMFWEGKKINQEIIENYKDSYDIAMKTYEKYVQGW